MSMTNIHECPLGQALRGVREELVSPAIDWSKIPLGRFFEKHARELAERRKSHDSDRAQRIKWLDRARRSSLAKRSSAEVRP